MARGLKIALFVLIVPAGFGLAVLQLWNSLIPNIFGLRPIGFWQAVGLMALSWILFGGLGMFRGRPHGSSRWRQRMAARWEQMPPEERAKFREGMRSRCGRGRSEAPETATPA